MWDSRQWWQKEVKGFLTTISLIGCCSKADNSSRGCKSFQGYFLICFIWGIERKGSVNIKTRLKLLGYN